MLTASNGKSVFLLAGQYGGSFPRCSERSSRGALHTSSKTPCYLILFLQPKGLRLVLCQTSGGGHCLSHLEGPLQRVGPGHLRVKCWEAHGIYAKEQLTPNEKKKRLEHVSACLVAALLRHELLLVTSSHLSTENSSGCVSHIWWSAACHEHMMCGSQERVSKAPRWGWLLGPTLPREVLACTHWLTEKPGAPLPKQLW